jgi:hypothetical protein
MFTKHITELAEAYLNNQLSSQERQLVKEHLAECPICTRYLFDVQRLRRELGPVMKHTLGTPLPPPDLRYQIRHKVKQAKPSRLRYFLWTASEQTVSQVSSLAITVMLVLGLIAVIHTAMPSSDSVSTQIVLITPSSTIIVSVAMTPEIVHITPTAPGIDSLHDSLPTFTNLLTVKGQPVAKMENTVVELVDTSIEIPEPVGLLAFAVFDQPQYTIRLLNLADKSEQIFNIRGVSEPAIHKTEAGHRMTYRAWGNPTRALLSSDLTGQKPDRLTYFWEDAQPDWSPTENRIIFASQREVDRKWRLYSAWGDGSLEVNLRREGKSPTFAPDGYQFAFESCDDRGYYCGLWQGNLNNSEYGSKPFLKDALAKSPDWSPLDDRIVYMANPADNWDLYLTTATGGNVQRLTDDPAQDGVPTWSPDGKWLAFFSDRNNSWGIWLLHVDSGELRPVYDFGKLALTNPANASHWWDEQLSWSE